MVEQPPTNEHWRKLYEAATYVKELKPWQWMTEADIFGVQDPETAEIGFVSVMGMLGEYYAVSLYPNPGALYDFLALQEAGPEGNAEAVLEIAQIHASFEDRDELENRDRQLIKELGFKFRGRKQWPMFRSYRPGYMPWFIEAEEARFLAEALTQLLEVAPRFREDRSLLEPDEGGSYLVRVANEQQDGTLVWQDRMMEVPPPEPRSIQIQITPQTLQSLERLPRSSNVFEMDLFMFPAPIQENKEVRPIFPYMLLTVDAASAMVVGTELLTPDPSLEAMWGSVAEQAAKQLAGLEIMPQEVVVQSELLAQLLEPLSEVSGFELKQAHSLQALDEAKGYLLSSAY